MNRLNKKQKGEQTKQQTPNADLKNNKNNHLLMHNVGI